jgi:hypothetical protein
MSSNKLYSEILEEFEACQSDNERIAILQKYGDKNFRTFLQLVFDPQIIFDAPLPNTYRPAIEPAGLNYTYLSLEVPKLYRFIKNHPKRSSNLTPEKQTQLISVILEALHKDEARLFVNMFQKDLKVKHLTTHLVEKAYN